MGLIHQKIKRLREERRLTLKDVADGIGVPLTTYREWEYGRAIRPKNLVKLSAFFGVSLDELNGISSLDLSLEERLSRALNDIAIVREALTKRSKGK